MYDLDDLITYVVVDILEQATVVGSKVYHLSIRGRVCEVGILRISLST